MPACRRSQHRSDRQVTRSISIDSLVTLRGRSPAPVRVYTMHVTSAIFAYLN